MEKRKCFNLTQVSLAVALLSVTFVFSSGCSSSRLGMSKNEYRMGEKVQVGTLIYNVLETEWKSQLGEQIGDHIPSNRFLIVKLVVTNSGGQEARIPVLSLEDSNGRSYPELSAGASVPQWLGMLRKLAPADTQEGRVIFDVPMSAYKLRVSDGEVDTEKNAFVQIPLQLSSETPALPGPIR